MWKVFKGVLDALTSLSKRMGLVLRGSQIELVVDRNKNKKNTT